MARQGWAGGERLRLEDARRRPRILGGEIIALCRSAAKQLDLDASILCGQVERESSGNSWQVRYEDAFRQRYIVPLKLPFDEEIARSMSYGLLQVMGETAREFGFAGQLAALCEPQTGLILGARILRHKLAVNSGNYTAALLSYNGGGNPDYPRQVLALALRYAVPKDLEAT